MANTFTGPLYRSINSVRVIDRERNGTWELVPYNELNKLGVRIFWDPLNGESREVEEGEPEYVGALARCWYLSIEASWQPIEDPSNDQSQKDNRPAD